MTALRGMASASGAVVIAVLLFYLMQALVAPGGRIVPVVTTTASLEPIRVLPEPPATPPPPVTERSAPEPVTPRRPQLALAIAPVQVDVPAVELPEFDLPVAITGRTQSAALATGVAGRDALAAFAPGEAAFQGAELIPVASARPRYPRSAAERGIEGWVEVIFVVTGAGRVENVRVLDASPRGVFEDAAVAAMRNFVYAPYYVAGKAVAREGTQLFRFRVEDIQDIYLWDD